MKKSYIYGIGIFAIACFQSLQAQVPDTLEWLLQRGEAHVAAEQYSDAVSLYTQVLVRDDVVPAQVCFFFGKALYHVHRLEEAGRFLDFYKDRVHVEDPHQGPAAALLAQVRTALDAIEGCARCDARGYRYKPHALCAATGYLPTRCAACHGGGV